MSDENPASLPAFHRSTFTSLAQNLVTEVQLVLQPAHSTLDNIPLVHLATVRRDILSLMITMQKDTPAYAWTAHEAAGMKLLEHMKGMVESLKKIKEGWEDLGRLLRDAGMQVVDVENGIRRTERNEEASGKGKLVWKSEGGEGAYD